MWLVTLGRANFFKALLLLIFPEKSLWLPIEGDAQKSVSSLGERPFCIYICHIARYIRFDEILIYFYAFFCMVKYCRFAVNTISEILAENFYQIGYFVLIHFI